LLVTALVAFSVLFLIGLGYLFYRGYLGRGISGKATAARMSRLWAWFQDPAAHFDWRVSAGERCGDAPFIMPTNGYIGFIWGDSFRIGHRHQGLDIFGGEAVNTTPVVVAYPGYLTRLPEWKSSLIVRVPVDPLSPGRQIWVYYTHMASQDGESFISPEFPPGTRDVYVEAGTLLGYQGNYSGTPGNPTGVHLHFSIVRDDGAGSFMNELEIDNTLDPSPYLGMPLNLENNQGVVPICDAGELSSE
jgi:murein DD-endopeptidase MepM/ murein hydrolase activator NlpD